MNKKVKGAIWSWIFALIMVFATLPMLRMVFEKPIDIHEALKNPDSGMPVTVDVDKVIDWMQISGYRDKSDTYTSHKEFYCMVCLDDNKVIAMLVLKKDRDIIADIMDGTWDYAYGKADSLPEKVRFTGTLHAMNDEEGYNFIQTIIGEGFMPEDAYYYVIDTTNRLWAGYMSLVVVTGLVIAGFVFIILAMVKGDKKKTAYVNGPAEGDNSDILKLVEEFKKKTEKLESKKMKNGSRGLHSTNEKSYSDIWDYIKDDYEYINDDNYYINNDKAFYDNQKADNEKTD